MESARHRRVAALVMSLIALVVVPSAMPQPAGGGPAGAVSQAGAAASSPVEIAIAYIRSHRADFGLTGSDVSDIGVSDSYQSRHNGVTHVYLQQQHRGIGVFAGLATVNVAKDGSVISAAPRFVSNLAAAVRGQALREPAQAAADAARHLGLRPTKEFQVLETRGGPARETVLSDGGVALSPIRAMLVWLPLENGAVRLAWSVEIEETSAEHWWNALVDAESGQLLKKVDYVDHDDASTIAAAIARPESAATAGSVAGALGSPNPVLDGSSYNVFALPLESPNDGPRTLESNPADALASPFGWHDTNGLPGPEFTITRGNNVRAYLDQDNDNAPDSFGSPDGGPALTFDFPFDPTEHAQGYRELAVASLFYHCNIIHDVSHLYGFTEEAGNFQATNYAGFTGAGDFVNCEAQDGGGTSNANFATPVDGSQPRMQMYLWPGPDSPNEVVVDGVGTFASSWARFGPAPSAAGASGEIIDAGNGCTPADYAVAPAGDWIAIVTGSNVVCENIDKARQAAAAGAKAVIIARSDSGSAPILTGSLTTAGPTVPAASITQADGDTIRAAVAAGPVTGTVRKNPSHPGIRDGDLDAGVIYHEYTHGISNRLTGGPSTVACLDNQEQMSEGWSDWVAIALTALPTDSGPQPRGIGTYVAFQPDRSSGGIRPTPYSTDMTINPSTYDTIKSAAVPHGLGYVWATMLWDLYWDLVDEHGFNPDPYGDWTSGGNNLAIQLVIDGMKMQPCSPGFVDARDAILHADQALTAGENQCTIWAAFARRGLGVSADQGLSTSRSDGTEAFDLPLACQPGAGFAGSIGGPPATNTRTAGSNAPVVFSLGGDKGLAIFAADYPKSQQIDCDSKAAMGTLESTMTPGSSRLSYDADEDRYTYPWRTVNAWRNTCRKLVLRLSDGSELSALFRFVR